MTLDRDIAILWPMTTTTKWRLELRERRSDESGDFDDSRLTVMAVIGAPTLQAAQAIAKREFPSARFGGVGAVWVIAPAQGDDREEYARKLGEGWEG